MDPEFVEELKALMNDPSRFPRVRELVIASAGYSPYGNTLEKASALHSEGKHRACVDLVMGDMPNLLLSPRAHFILATCFRALGNPQGEQAEVFMGQLMLRCIFDSGDGSQQRPYLVLRTSDEYDVVFSLEKRPASQALLHVDGRHIDRLTLEDGSELNFDVTAVFGRGM